MYHHYSQEDLRAYCRTSIESFEIWAKRLIHEQFSARYGQDYAQRQIAPDEYVFNSETRKHIASMLANNPGRFSKPVDTLFLDQIISVICNPKWYHSLFKDALDHAYPTGVETARAYLSRIIPVRNRLSHSNPISVRQAEQAICYSHDFIDGLKAYYKEKGEEQMWNVPRIIRITDSQGNTFENPSEKNGPQSSFWLSQKFYCGDTYSVSVEIDSSFDPTDYDIIWKKEYLTEIEECRNSTQFTIQFSTQDIQQGFSITCYVISHKSWHRFSFYDCSIALIMDVFPPL